MVTINNIIQATDSVVCEFIGLGTLEPKQEAMYK